MISSTYPLGFGGAYEPKNSTTPSEIFLRRSSVSRPELCLDFTASSLRTIPVTDTASAGQPGGVHYFAEFRVHCDRHDDRDRQRQYHRVSHRQRRPVQARWRQPWRRRRSEEHTSELQSLT